MCPFYFFVAVTTTTIIVIVDRNHLLTHRRPSPCSTATFKAAKALFATYSHPSLRCCLHLKPQATSSHERNLINSR